LNDAESAPLRLSELADVDVFHRKGPGCALLRRVSTRYQVSLNRGSNRSDRSGQHGLPVMTCLPLSHGGPDFTDSGLMVLATMQRMARPIPWRSARALAPTGGFAFSAM
jgi:hypothetical protein